MDPIRDIEQAVDAVMTGKDTLSGRVAELEAEVRRLRSERDTWQSSAREWESYAKRLEVERDRMGTLRFETAFLIEGEPEQLIFRGPTGQVVLRRLHDEEAGS